MSDLDLLEWTTVKLPLSSLTPWEDNPVYLSEHDAAEIARSIRKFGLAHALLANAPTTSGADVRILDGHQRKRVLTELLLLDEDTIVDVRVPERELTDAECDELTIRLRRNTGSLDYDVLANKHELDNLLEWGFTARDFQLAGYGDVDVEPPESFEEYDEEIEYDHECPKCAHRWRGETK